MKTSYYFFVACLHYSGQEIHVTVELVYIIRNRLEFLDLKASEKIARVSGGLFGDREKKNEKTRAKPRAELRAGTRSSLSLSPYKPQATKAKNVTVYQNSSHNSLKDTYFYK